MAEGWIKLHRKMLDSAVWSGGLALKSVWVWCLLKASFAERETLIGGKLVRLQPGQFVTGRQKGAEESGLAPSTFRDTLDKLEEIGNIRQDSDSRATVITIVNWETYQLLDGECRQNPDSQPTASRQPADTIIRREEGKKVGAPRFDPPDKSDVWAYAQEYRDEKKLTIGDPVLREWCANFYDFFLERNWTLSNGRKMTDWLAALRRWIRTDYQRLLSKRTEGKR